MGRIAKTLAASRASRHKKVDSLHTDGSSLSQHETVTSGITAGGEKIVLDASRTTVGKTADLECRAIEDSFADLAEMLDDWHAEAEAAGVDGTGIGDSSNFGLHQLGGGGAVHGDNCAQGASERARAREQQDPEKSPAPASTCGAESGARLFSGSCCSVPSSLMGQNSPSPLLSP